MPVLPVPGVTDGPEWAVTLNAALTDMMMSRPFPVGLLSNVLPHNSAGATGVLYTQGYENAVGVVLPPMTIDAVQTCIHTAAVPPAEFRIGMRKFGGLSHLPGPPIMDQVVPSTSTGDKLIVLGTPLVLDGGLYAVTWAVYGETTATLKPWAGPNALPFPAVSLSINALATGTLNMMNRINTNIAGPFPQTVSMIGSGANQGPITFSVRRSA